MIFTQPGITQLSKRPFAFIVNWGFRCTAICMIACTGPSFTLIDRTGLELAIQNVKLQKNKTFSVMDGESIREIDPKFIQKLTIDPSKTYYQGSKLYYQVVIVLSDGTHIKPRKDRVGLSKSFLAIDETLVGYSNAGKVTIKLEDINVMTQIVEEAENVTE